MTERTGPCLYSAVRFKLTGETLPARSSSLQPEGQGQATTESSFEREPS